MADSTPENAAEPSADASLANLVAAAAAAAAPPEMQQAGQASTLAQAAAATASAAGGDLSGLPPYKRNVLQVRVPVTVALASQRKSIRDIIEMGPGSIVKFDQTCDRPLQLTVGKRMIAEGEVVKVGDKFGLKISRMLAPSESK